MGRIYNMVVQLLIVRGFIDTQCGFKLMTGKVAHEVTQYQRITSFSFDVELILIARRLGYRVKDVPVKWINSPASRVHPIRDSFYMLLDLFRIKLYDIAGFYRKREERE